MSLPTNRVKKVTASNGTVYDIVPEMLQKSGYSAELPTLTANSTIALTSDIPTKTSELTNDSKFAVTNANNNFSEKQTIVTTTNDGSHNISLVLQNTRTQNYVQFRGKTTNGTGDDIAFGDIGVNSIGKPIFYDEINNKAYTLATTADIPTNYVTTDTAQTVSGTKTLTGGLKVSGRYVGSGDDEGIVVGPAPNSYAGLICGSPSGRRAVFYLKPSSNAGYNSVWRYNNGSTTYDIAHPEKAGIIALLDDIPNDGVVNATASTNVKRDSSGNVNAVAFDLCTASTSTVNAKMSYDSTNECIKFTF